MTFDTIKHAQRERLFFLDQHFLWQGSANRRDLIEKFGISTAQAALDFKAYLAIQTLSTPLYNTVLKTYVAPDNYVPVFKDEAYAHWEAQIYSIQNQYFDELPNLRRASDPQMMSLLSRVMHKKQMIEVLYTSMSTGDQSHQWIVPTRFASDGNRIHLRGYSLKHKSYRDYIPIRINKNSSFKTKVINIDIPIDIDWHTMALISLIPKQSLLPEQASAVRQEYNFDGEYLCIKIRKALEFYVDRRWGLDQPNTRLERLKTEYKLEL